MAKLVLLHKPDSIYDDVPDIQYDFPKVYRKRVETAMGDWIVYCEPAKAGPRGYFAAAKITAVVPNPRVTDRFHALIEAGSYLEFDRTVPRMHDGRMLESALATADGSQRRGGAVQNAVRALPEAEFATIVDLGLPPDLESIEARRFARGLEEPAAPFHRPVLERLTRRPYRDVAFRRRVREAYDYRCAISGLRLRNGGDRPEVQAAHIRPVNLQGSDHVHNGLALSGTLHWMFDRGLISVAEDCRTILVSHNKVPAEVVSRLIAPGGQLVPPRNLREAPHPANLQWHRENVFGQSDTEGPVPWA